MIDDECFVPNGSDASLLHKLQVSFQWKNPDFLSKNPDFLSLKNVDFYNKNSISLIITGYTYPSLTWPLTIIGFSFWLPQIVMNILKDADPRRPAFSTKYVVGMTLTRLLVPVYLHGWGDNHLHMQPNVPACVALVLYVVAQMGVLLAQQRYGAILPWMRPLIPAKVSTL